MRVKYGFTEEERIMRINDATDALSAVKGKLDEINEDLTKAGMPPLEDADWTWHERSEDLLAAASQAIFSGYESGSHPSRESLAELGAHVVAYLVALQVSEETRIDTGDDVT